MLILSMSEISSTNCPAANDNNANTRLTSRRFPIASAVANLFSSSACCLFDNFKLNANIKPFLLFLIKYSTAVEFDNTRRRELYDIYLINQEEIFLIQKCLLVLFTKRLF